MLQVVNLKQTLKIASETYSSWLWTSKFIDTPIIESYRLASSFTRLCKPAWIFPQSTTIIHSQRSVKSIAYKRPIISRALSSESIRKWCLIFYFSSTIIRVLSWWWAQQRQTWSWNVSLSSSIGNKSTLEKEVFRRRRKLANVLDERKNICPTIFEYLNK